MAQLKDIGSEVTQFGKDIETETKRITWPSRQDAIKSTLAVVLISVVFASFLGLVDYAFSYLVRLLLS